MHILLYFLLTLHVLVCLLIVLVVLMQRPRSEGLGAAFGSGMTENIFGAQTTHVLAKATTWLGGAFFVLTLGLAMVYSRLYAANTSIDKQLMKLPVPVASATPKPVGKPLPPVSSGVASATTAAKSMAPATPVPTARPSATPLASPANTAPNIPVESPASKAN